MKKVLLMNSEENKVKSKFVWQIGLTGIIGVGWFVFLITWLFFFAMEFDIYKNIAILVTSFIIAAGVIGAVWMTAMKGMKDCKNAMSGVKGLGWRMLLSMVVMASSVVLFLVWFYFYAVDYNVYQNLAILITQILVTIGILVATWVTFKLDLGDENKECFPNCFPKS